MVAPEPLANFYGLSTVDLDSKRFFLFIVQTAGVEQKGYRVPAPVALAPGDCMSNTYFDKPNITLNDQDIELCNIYGRRRYERGQELLKTGKAKALHRDMRGRGQLESQTIGCIGEYAHCLYRGLPTTLIDHGVDDGSDFTYNGLNEQVKFNAPIGQYALVRGSQTDKFAQADLIFFWLWSHSEDYSKGKRTIDNFRRVRLAGWCPTAYYLKHAQKSNGKLQHADDLMMPRSMLMKHKNYLDWMTHNTQTTLF